MDSYTREAFLQMWKDHQALVQQHIEAIRAHNNYVSDQRYFYQEFESQRVELEKLNIEFVEMREAYESKIAELLEKLSGREEECLELSYKCQALEAEIGNLQDRLNPCETQVQREAPGDVIETGLDWYKEHNEVEHGGLITPNFDDVPQIRIPLDDQLLQAASDLRRQIEAIQTRIPPNEQLIKTVRDLQNGTLTSP